jgi:hypothetical protein
MIECVIGWRVGVDASAGTDTSVGRGASARMGMGVGNDRTGDRACDGAEASELARVGVPLTRVINYGHLTHIPASRIINIS